MALFIPGGPAGGAPSGSLGATVFSHGRFGSYMRTRVIPTNPGSAGQVLARNRMSSLTNAWYNVLTEVQRAAWTTYAANVPITNRIGQQIYLTGLNWYVACNSLRRQADGTITDQDDAPTIFNLATFEVAEIGINESTQLITFAFTTGLDWLLDEGAILLWATRPQNASINFNNLPYRYAGAVEGDTASPPTSPQTVAVPFPVVEDQVVWVRFNCINPDGRIGPVQKYRIEVAA